MTKRALEKAHVDVVNLRHAWGDRVVYDGLSCRFVEGKITVVLGASGGGKTTLMRMIACLGAPDFGDIWVGDQEITCMPERQAQRFRRKIGMMFQSGALLDSMTVYDNVALPLREHTRLTEGEIRQEVHAQFDSVGLENVDELLPGELSGGMMRRVALARALIRKPEILLCDEPFSGLDPPMVRLIEALLVEVNQRLGVTMLVTSHHIGSTLRMAHQIVFLCGGGAVQGPTREIEHSTDPRIAGFFASGEGGEGPGDRSRSQLPSPGQDESV